jgi:hypothetical protein
MAENFDAEQAIREVTDTLQRKFPEKSAEEVEAAVREQVEGLAARPVRDYVSVLAKRAAKKQLDAS